MTVAALLTQLNQQSIKLGLNADGSLKVRAPKGALTPALRQVLADNKPALLDWLRERENEAPPIRPVGRDRDLPLSYAQQRLWVLEQVEGAGAVYNVPAAMRLKARGTGKGPFSFAAGTSAVLASPPLVSVALSSSEVVVSSTSAAPCCSSC